MTVSELIQELQDCDKPDAEVVLNGRYGYVGVKEVSYDDSKGPVTIEGESEDL